MEKMRKKSFLQRTLLPIIPIISLASVLCLSTGCGSPASPVWAPTPVPPVGDAQPPYGTATPTLPPASLPTPAPTVERRAGDLSDEAAATLNSLEKADDYPLYVMHYYGAYNPQARRVAPQNIVPLASPLLSLTPLPPAWACSLFAAPGKADNGLYGRNFDWEYSPAVLLFTAPPDASQDAYASVSMVDIAYLGFGGSKAGGLTDLPLEERRALLYAPFLPFDGMNEYGLTVGMAAVPGSEMPHDPNKEAISSLGIIREMLDHARDVGEAVALMQSYNISMEGGPPIHYLIADSAGRSALVEFDAGEMVIIANENAWHLATNHLRTAGDETGHSGCWRYDKMYQRLAETGGQLATQDALDLLAGVSQESTQWSVVYGMRTGDVNVAMGREYTAAHTFHLGLVGR
jgi:hypothetical protein